MNSAQGNWTPAYLGLGSNLDDPVNQIERAVAGLQNFAATSLVAVSPLYKNPPMGPQDQPDYVNAVAGILTRQSAQNLLQLMQSLEIELGRQRKAGDRWGPRIIDLDLLVYGRAHLSEPGLNLPHPGIFERNFVLLPLCNIAPTLHVPGQGVVGVLAAQVDKAGLQRIDA